MNTLNTITILPSTKKEIEIYCNNIKEEILQGNESPLKILKQLKAFELVIKELLKDNELKDCFVNEAYKFKKGQFEFSECKFQVKNSPAKWNYSNCNDSKYNQLVNKLNLAKEELKAREKFLQNIKDVYEDESTGEIINPPLKMQSEIISVTLK